MAFHLCCHIGQSDLQQQCAYVCVGQAAGRCRRGGSRAGRDVQGVCGVRGVRAAQAQGACLGLAPGLQAAAVAVPVAAGWALDRRLRRMFRARQE